ncbi:MAG: ABC transporter ATP-binding protein/permease [Bacteroidales bacterium]|nr:ABC transporter ATP-binding protein/permease [Bacteroidales bacterium]
MNALKKIAYYLKPYWPHASWSVVFTFFGTIFSLFSFTMIIPFLGILFDQQKIVTEPVEFALTTEAIEHNFTYFVSRLIINQGAPTALLVISLLVVASMFLKTLFTYLGKYVIAPLRNGIVRDIRNRLFNKTMQLSLSYYSEERKGDLISRMTADVQEVEATIIRSLDKAIKSPITVIVYLVSLFVMSTKLTLFVLIFIPLTGSVIGWIGKALKKKSAQGQKRLGMLLSYIEESLYGLRIVKAFNSEERVKKRFFDENEKYTRLMNKIWRRKDLASPLTEFLSVIIIVTIMWFGGNLILTGDGILSPQAFIAYIAIFSQIIPPAKNLSSIYYNIQKGMASFDRVESVLNAKVTIKDKPNALSLDEFKNHIEFRNVWFKYQEEYVLQDINLMIEKGQTIALVGQSGAGKSTLADMLPRFYDTVKGELLIDGLSVKDIKVKDLRKIMGVVSQESILFNDTIFNNIAFGIDNPQYEEVERAARIANAHEFIMQTEEGYYTNIGDRGSKLSGGQRQRISIARAILKNPPVLILDEATSSLDTESEKLVQDALNNLMKNRTSIVIAHRLSTIRNADMIYVLHQGRILEQGKHDHLLQKNGAFKALYDQQFSN